MTDAKHKPNVMIDTAWRTLRRVSSSDKISFCYTIKTRTKFRFLCNKLIDRYICLKIEVTFIS